MSAPLTVRRLWGRQLRDAGPGALLALVTLLTAAFVTLIPVAESRAYDQALGDVLRVTPPGQRDLLLSDNAGAVLVIRGDFEKEKLLLPTSPETVLAARAEEIMGPEAFRLLGAPDFSATTIDFAVTGPGRSPIGTSRQAMLRVQAGLDEHVRWESGGLRARTGKTKAYVDAEEPFRVSRTTPVIPVVVPAYVAQQWQIAVGDTFALTPANPGRNTPYPVTVELTGIYAPRDAADAFWSDEARLLRNDVVVAWDGGTSSRAAFMVDPRAVGELGQALDAIPAGFGGFAEDSPFARGLSYEWRYVLDPEHIDLADARVIMRGIDALRLASTAWGGTPPEVLSGLPGILRTHAQAVTVTRALAIFVTIALTALGAVAAALLVTALAERRGAAVRLQSARGASPSQLTFGFLLEVALWTVPPVLLAAGAGWRFGASLPRSLALAAIPLGIALLAALVASRRLLRTSRSDPLVGLAARILTELGVLAAAYFAVTTVRSRGRTITDGALDWYAALTPVLLAAAVAVVVLRVLPWPIRGVARMLGRGRSVLAFVGLARASRGGGRLTTPLAGLVIAATLATFLGGLAVSIQRERGVAAYARTGADARIDAQRIDPEEVRAIAARPGITAALPAYVGAGEVTGRGSAAQKVTILGIDPMQYAEALAATPLAFDPGPAGGSAERLVGLASDPLRPTGELSVTVSGSPRPIAVGAVEPGLRRTGSAAAQLPVLLLPWQHLLAGQAYLQPNTLFIFGSADAVGAVVQDAPVGLAVGSVERRVLEADVAGQALPRLIRMLFITGLALAAAFTVLALLVILTLSRPDRVAALLRLRVLGLPRRRDWVLGLVEVLPAASAAILGGVGLGVGLPRVMSAAINLGPFTGGAADPPIDTPLWLAAAVAASLLLLTVLAVLLDLARARTTSLSAHLRAGEQR